MLYALILGKIVGIRYNNLSYKKESTTLQNHLTLLLRISKLNAIEQTLFHNLSLLNWQQQCVVIIQEMFDFCQQNSLNNCVMENSWGSGLNATFWT